MYRKKRKTNAYSAKLLSRLFKITTVQIYPRRAEVLYPFKGKYTPLTDEPQAKKPRTDGPPVTSENTTTGKLAWLATSVV